MALVLIDRKMLPPLGYCLYCGSTENLSREHIVPYAFLGNWVLQQASCGRCAEITGKLELACARDLFGEHRAQLGLRNASQK
jgi:hypothetical protein